MYIVIFVFFFFIALMGLYCVFGIMAMVVNSYLAKFDLCLVVGTIHSLWYFHLTNRAAPAGITSFTLSKSSPKHLLSTDIISEISLKHTSIHFSVQGFVTSEFHVVSFCVFCSSSVLLELCFHFMLLPP